MEAAIGARVIGQEEAVAAVSDAVRRACAGLRDPNRPLGSFVYLGPTGVGKTELTKALAAFLFDDVSALLRIDMSEYMEKHSVARLIGAPPGYVGYDEGGALTEAVRRRPYQVILFDEIEKAHGDVFNVLTSNLGSEILAAQPADRDSSSVRDEVMEVVRAAFRPEFHNRLDEILLFHRLSREHMTAIVDIQLDRLAAMLADRKIGLEVDAGARQWLGDQGYDPVYGARPLKRVIQRRLQNPMASLILEGRIQSGETVRVSTGDDGLVINGVETPAIAAE
jgi:ATP-dependent Clp protease ATP-binding subunit ClpB